MNHRPMQIMHDFRILATASGDVRVGLSALQAQGIGGLVTNIPFDNYMEDPALWADLRSFIRACRDMGMRVWLYDEEGYPSGYAGGRVLANRPDLEARGLYFDQSTHTFSQKPSYESTHNCNNYFARCRTPNLLEPAAVAEFIRVTHEKYASELAEELSHVEAFFTDEPALNVLYFPPIAAASQIPVIDPPDVNRRLLPGVPWSAALADTFAATDLSGLFRDQPDSPQLRRRFYSRVAHDLALNCFGQLRSWCAAHGLASSGHLLWEEQLHTHAALYGNPLRSLMQLDIPGYDILSGIPLDGYRSSQKAAILAASAAMLLGKRRIFCESSDYSQQLGQRRLASAPEASASLAWQAALGTTDFALYYSYGLSPGLPKPTFDFMPPDVPRFSRSPEDFRAINTSVTALLDELAPAALRPDVFLYYPIELLQQAYHPVLRPWEDKSPETLRIAQAYDQALSTLLDSGIVPCIVDGQMIQEVRRTADGGPTYQIMQARANAIIYPAGCELPADCRPAAGIELLPLTPDLPRRLFQAGHCRILKDNPNICSGVMHRDGQLLLTLVNLTGAPQSCHIQSRQRRTQHALAPYQAIILRLDP